MCTWVAAQALVIKRAASPLSSSRTSQSSQTGQTSQTGHNPGKKSSAMYSSIELYLQELSMCTWAAAQALATSTAASPLSSSQTSQAGQTGQTSQTGHIPEKNARQYTH